MANNQLQQAQINASITQLYTAADSQIGELIGDNSPTTKRLVYSMISKAVEQAQTSKRPFIWDKHNTRNFIADVARFATAGLDPLNDEVYIYPQGKEMSVVISYRGYKKLLIKYAKGVKDMRCFTIREGDDFKVEYTSHSDEWTYDHNLFNTGRILGYVTIISFDDGTSRVMEHTLQDIAKRKALAGNGKGTSPAWEKWPEEMAHAKAIKRHAKSVCTDIKPEGLQLMNELDHEDMGIRDITPEPEKIASESQSKVIDLSNEDEEETAETEESSTSDDSSLTDEDLEEYSDLAFFASMGGDAQ